MRRPEKDHRTPTGASHPRRRKGGFSLVEMVVATGIAASILSAAALVFSSVGLHQRRLSTFGAVEIGPQANGNFYSLTSATVDSYTAPNYGRAARADMMRDVFWDDIAHSCAVYCLGRTGLNTTRPVYIPHSKALDGRNLDTPEAFRLHLASVLTSTSSVYQFWRGKSGYDNGSIYILQPSGFEEFLAVRAIYDIDINTTTNPAGTYASVKRYSLNVLTDYYDVFYPEGANEVPFKPLFVLHERRARLSHTADGESAYTDYKTAADMPFYYIWWPDPAAPALNKQAVTPTSTYAPSIPGGVPHPLPNYAEMAGRTSYFFTVPMFPSQL